MQYEVMIPPFECVDFLEMNKRQVKEYFDWYISQIDHRISLLSDTVMEEDTTVCFDYSVESLIPLWEWYENKISFRKLDDSEYQDRLHKYPDWMKSYISNEDLSYTTLVYGMDIALYFAEVLIRNTEKKVKWGYFTKPRNRMSVNEPTLLGFKNDDDLNPRLIVLNCARRSRKERQKTRLYNMYYTWTKYL